MNKSQSKGVLSRSASKVLSKATSRSQFPNAEIDRKSISSKTANRAADKIKSLEQLTSLIQELMDEKRKINNKNFEKKECYETTEEFLFSFFSRKYGLKDIALDWSLSTIRSIEKYCKDSIEVEVFGKILKNQLYEQYYDECRQFKKDISQAFRR
jgi:uncharacterized iron-regulated protein